MSHHPELERSFHERYWAVQNRHLAAALLYRSGLLVDQAKRALERSRHLVQAHRKTVTKTSGRPTPKQEQLIIRASAHSGIHRRGILKSILPKL